MEELLHGQFHYDGFMTYRQPILFAFTAVASGEVVSANSEDEGTS
jgi:hypothetical protein